MRVDERTAPFVALAVMMAAGAVIAASPAATLKGSDAGRITRIGWLAGFTNSKHDFPQTIRYRRMPDGSLLAQIEGPSGGRKRVIDYPMQHVGCEASP